MKLEHSFIGADSFLLIFIISKELLKGFPAYDLKLITFS
jgi:hypothetical protein